MMMEDYGTQKTDKLTVIPGYEDEIILVKKETGKACIQCSAILSLDIGLLISPNRLKTCSIYEKALFILLHFALMGNQVFLIATHFASEKVLKTYTNIYDATTASRRTFLLYHQKNNILPEKLAGFNTHIFTDEILYSLGYIPLCDTLLPGSNHFGLLDFFLEYPQFEYYWYIEGDVRFNGDWNYLFKAFKDYKDDFISSLLEFYKDNTNWPWWKILAHPSKSIPIENRLKSFNPIYRISHSALSFIHKSLLSRWCGHHEVLLPTLLYHNHYSIMDFGGQGQFVPSGFKNKFYTSDTLRWRPVFTKAGDKKNKLYYPIKTPKV